MKLNKSLGGRIAHLEAGSSQNFLDSHKLRISGKILPMGTSPQHSDQRVHKENLEKNIWKCVESASQISMT